MAVLIINTKKGLSKYNTNCKEKASHNANFIWGTRQIAKIMQGQL